MARQSMSAELTVRDTMTLQLVTASTVAAQEVVTLSEEDTIETSTYADLHRRSQLCALALEQLGVGYAPSCMSADAFCAGARVP